MLFSSWSDPAELAPDCFVDYYAAIQATDRSNSQPPDGYPAGELETLILQRFHIPAEHIRASTMYKEDTDSYLCEGIGGGADTTVAAVEQNGEILSISYEVYDPDDSDSLLWGGILFIQLGSDGSYQYLEHKLTNISQGY